MVSIKTNKIDLKHSNEIIEDTGKRLIYVKQEHRQNQARQHRQKTLNKSINSRECKKLDCENKCNPQHEPSMFKRKLYAKIKTQTCDVTLNKLSDFTFIQTDLTGIQT